MLPSEEVAASVLLGIGDSCGNSDAKRSSTGSARPTTTDDGFESDPNSISNPDAKARKYIAEPVKDPGEHDVLCGRGGEQ
jgi:hypothetical protein